MDVIGIEREGSAVRAAVRRRPASGWGAPLVAAAVVTAALLGLLAGRLSSTDRLFGGGTLSGLTGRMVLELQDGSYVKEQSLTDQAEYRGQDWTGTVTVEAGGDHSGRARLQGSASYVPTDFGPVVAHHWGRAEVTLDGQSCSGTYAYSAYRGSQEGGGSMHLRCDGGSVLGATITAAGTEPPSDDGSRSWQITIALSDGHLVER